MADTTTTQRGFTKIEVGASDNSWGQKLNSNFDLIDRALAATLTKGTTSGAITLTAEEHGYSRIRLNGTLVGNLTVEFDGTHGGVWIIDNDVTAGGFTVTAKVTGQTGVVIPAGSNRLVFFNGTDIEELGTATADAQVAAIAALVPTADKAMIWSSETAITLVDTTTYGRSLWNVANEAALKSLINAEAGVDFQAFDDDLAAIALLTTTALGRSLLEVANAAAIRTLAGLVIGTDVLQLGLIAGYDAVTANTTLALADVGKLKAMNNSSTRTFTIPANATVAFPLYATIPLARIGTGAVNVTAASGVTLNGVSQGSGAISAQWNSATLIKVGENAWQIYGAIGPVA